MNKKLLTILSTTLLLATISIPTYASVAENDLKNYNNKLSTIKNEFNLASSNSNTNGIYDSETKAKTFLNELNNYINSNTVQNFQLDCNNTINIMDKYRNYKYNQLQEQEKITGFGSAYGRDGSRINTNFYLDTCSLLLNDLKNYSTSFEWYVAENDVNNKHWKKENGKWYYYYENGKKAVNTTIDGFVIGSDGILVL